MGLLKPSGRSESNYRMYSEDDMERLRMIIQFRKTGISLEDIAKLLEMDKTNISDILTDRLKGIQTEIMELKKQEDMILAALMKEVKDSESSPFDNVTWTELLTSIGYSKEDLHKWHKNFEEDSPEKHVAFLKALGISQKKIDSFRRELMEK